MSKVCGIYTIRNIVNNKIYIGQSLYISKRFSNHKYKLKNDIHYNPYLQSSFNKYGFNNFIFETIEVCTEDNLNEREMYWVSFYKSYNRNFGYNIQEPSEDKNYKVSNETKMKIVELQTKYTDNELLEMIVKYFNNYNKIPSMNEFTNEYKGLITGDRVKARFNGFKNAVEKSGVFDLVESAEQTNGYYNREILLKFLRNWIDKNEKVPVQNSFKDDKSLPSIRPYLCEFGSLNDAIEILGYKPRRKKRNIV